MSPPKLVSNIGHWGSEDKPSPDEATNGARGIATNGAPGITTRSKGIATSSILAPSSDALGSVRSEAAPIVASDRS